MRRYTGRYRLLRCVLVSLTALASAALSLPGLPTVSALASPGLSTPGAISGTVTAAIGGAGLTGVSVDIYDSGGNFINSASSASDGTYSVTGLNPASYTVCFDASGASGGSSTTGYASQCYKNVAWSPGSNPPAGTTAVAVASGATVTGVGAALVADGVISGTVTAAAGGGGVTGVNADVYDASGNFITSASTAPDGTYMVTGLEPSATGYTVCFDASGASGGSSTTGYASQCYSNVAWAPGNSPPSGTTAVPVAAGVTVTGIGAALVADGAISGTVTAAAGGAGVSGVTVDLYDSSGNLATSGTTASDGTYTVTGLVPSATGYTVCFDATFASGGSATGYQSQCYSNVAWAPGNSPPSGTTAVPVAAGVTVTGIGAALAADGAISGTVTAALTGGTGVGGVAVDVYDLSGNFVASATTASDGTYTVGSLLPASYLVCFDASNASGGGSATGYQSQCYKNIAWTAGGNVPAGATAVPVTSGATATAIDAALAADGAISGTVTAAAGGAGVSSVTVDIYQAGTYVTSGSTAPDGTYTVTGLVPSATGYTVCFDASNATGGSSTTGYASQCYKNVAWSPGSNPPAGTTAVPVFAGKTATGIGAALTAQGAISGTVTAAAGGTGISDVSVDVYSANGNFGASASTASDGTYLVTGLVPSATGYTVCFDASNATGGSSTTGYASQCYKNVAWSPGSNPPAGTTAVPVFAGKTATGIGAALTAQGAISGTVTAAAGGTGISGVTVQITDSTGAFIAETSTAVTGAYLVTGLTPSATGYTVCFDASNATGGSSTTGYASQCYKNVAWSPGSNPPAGTTPVRVFADKTATGIGAALTAQGAISGTVTAAAGGKGVGNVAVDVYGPGGSVVAAAFTAADGTYTVTGVAPSAAGYAVCFDASFATGGGSATGYASQCYKNIAWKAGSAVPAGVTAVPVASGKTATGIGAALAADGGISGTVTAAAGGSGLTGVTVYVYDSGGNYITSTTTASGGTYTVTGLTPSTTGYIVCFNAGTATGGGSTTGYGNMCYKNVPWPTGGTLPTGTTAVPVTSGHTTAGIGAALPADGAISGAVTAAITGGTGVNGVIVSVYDSGGNYITGTTTASDGTYTVTGLTPSATGYRVCFDPSNASGGGSATGYQAQCYKNVPWSPVSGVPAGATAVPVGAGQTATAVSVALTPAGGISGTVTAVAGGGVGNVDVRVFSPTGQDVADVSTSTAGKYSVTGLSPSVKYAVCFDTSAAAIGVSKTGYQSQCYDNVAWTGGYVPAAGAAQLSVASAAFTTGINAALPAAGGISGTVSAATGGTGLSGVTVNVTTSTGGYVAQTSTTSSGSYVVAGLAGSATGYTVCFDASSASAGASGGGYESECYKNVPWSAGAAPPTGTVSVPVKVGVSTVVSAALVSEAGISGKVTSAATGAGLAGVNVRVFGGTGAYLLSATTGSDGTYTATGLAETGGGYIVCFDAATLNYASQCYRGIAWAGGYIPAVGAAPVQVSGTTPTTVSTALLGVGAIAGTVTASGTGKGIPNVSVDIYASSHDLFASATTGTDGTYTVTGLPKSAAGYTVCFDGSTASTAIGYASQCYKNVPWTRGASLPSGVTTVPVAVGKTATGIGAVLPMAGSIAGTVTAAVGGGGVSGVVADVYDQAGALLAAAATGTTGGYTVTGLTPLATGYTVCFDATGGTGGSSRTGYASQCYKNVPWSPGGNPPSGTTPAPVTPGKTTAGVSAALTADGAIAGTVKTSGGTPLSAVVVDVYDASGSFAASAATRTTGGYTVTGLSPNATGYTVCFDASGAAGGAAGYESQCYKGVAWTPGAPVPAGTKPVPVTAGKTATGISPVLAAAGAISGTVTAAGGGISGVGVDVLNASGILAGSATTAPDGTYTVTGLAPASYTVCFDASAISAAGFASQCYKNVPWTGGGQAAPPGTTAVAVKAGVTASGVGAVLASGVSVNGTVTASAGGLTGVNVDVFDASGNFLATAATASDGTYAVTGLAPSSAGYIVCFDASGASAGAPGGGTPAAGYASQCYKNVPWISGAIPPSGITLVRASSGTAITGVNAIISAAGSVSGTVTAKAGGAGLGGALVRLYRGASLLTEQFTAANGTYTLGGLSPSAGYTVCFDASNATGGTSKTGYASQCYKGIAWAGGQSALPKGTTAVSVTAGGAARGVSAALAPGSSITGSVTAATGGGALSGVSVDVFSGSTLIASASTAANGAYTVSGLAPTATGYTVCFDASFAVGGSSGKGYADQCYSNIAWSGATAPPATARLVKLAAAAVASNISAKLKTA